MQNFDPASSTLDPARLALWTEFQNKLASLPDKERKVFLLHGMGNYGQAEIAATRGLPPYKMKPPLVVPDRASWQTLSRQSGTGDDSRTTRGDFDVEDQTTDYRNRGDSLVEGSDSAGNGEERSRERPGSVLCSNC